MEKPLYSVIVPVYNTPASYIRTCVDSIQASCVSDYEILLADDGSGEETAQLLDSLSAKRENCRVIHLAHSGVSGTRNAGIRLARGRYLTFVDADDCLLPQFMERLKKPLEQEHPGVLIFNVARHMPDSISSVQTDISCRVCTPEELTHYYLLMNVQSLRSKDHWINRAPHGRVVRCDLAQKVLFNEEMSFAEDVIWNFSLLKAADSILVCAEQGYCYQETAFSATQAPRSSFPGEVQMILKQYRLVLGQDPQIRAEILAAAVEYFTILMRVYVFRQNPSDRYERYRSEIQKAFWKKIFSEVRTEQLRGRYAVTAILAKMHAYRLLYLLYWIYHAMKGNRGE